MANKFVLQLVLILAIITGLFTAIAITHWVYFSTKDILDGKLSWNAKTFSFSKKY